MHTFSARRAAFVIVFLVCAFVALIGRVAYLQTYGRQQTIRQAERQQHQFMRQQARRGSIFDRNGLLFACTIQTQTLYVDPKFMKEVYTQEGHSAYEMDDAVLKLAKIVDKNPVEMDQLLEDKSTNRFVKIAESLDETTCNEIQKLHLPGVGLQPTGMRYYPMGAIAAHILRGTMKDTHG